MVGLKKEEKLIIKVAKSITENNILLSEEDFEAIDWERFIQIIREQKIFLAVYGKIKDFMPDNVYEKYSSEYATRIEEINEYINEAKAISGKFDFNHCIVKGFILSQILYGNPYNRDFSDIDFFLLKDDIVNASYKLEALSYREINLLELEEFMQIPEFAKELYYHIDFEKQFTKEKIHVEIKSFASNEYSNNDIKIGLKDAKDIEINGIVFKTFDIKETFIYLITNVYTNFLSEWGIATDYKIRDLIDLKQFINKYHYIFNNDLLEYIKKRGKLDMMAEAMRILKEFYSSEFNLESIPNGFCNTKFNELSNKIFGDMPLYKRIFDKSERIKRYNNYVARNSMDNNVFQLVSAMNIANLKYYNYKNGDVKAQTPIWPNNPTFLNSLGGMILSGIDYNSNYIFINIKIPANYPDLCTRIVLKSRLNDDGFIVFNLSCDKINVSESNFSDYAVYFNNKDYYKVITVRIKRESNFEYEENNKLYYCLCYDMCIGHEYDPMWQKIAMWGSNNCYLKVSME